MVLAADGIPVRADLTIAVDERRLRALLSAQIQPIPPVNPQVYTTHEHSRSTPEPSQAGLPAPTTCPGSGE